MRRTFCKMHGCGNDYIYFDCMRQPLEDPAALSVRLSDRHKGVGGDGIVLVLPSDAADARMRMFNSDGSEGNMCGNAIRCVGKYLFDAGLVSKKALAIETASGVKHLLLFTGADGRVARVQVDMGAPRLNPQDVPVLLDGPRVVGRAVQVAGAAHAITCVSMGNPHCVVFCDDPDALDLPCIGPRFEHDPLFPERVNAEFVALAADGSLRMRVWERGSGETMACGTGACASVVAAVENGFCNRGKDVTVHLRGGDLVIRYTTEGTVTMTGEAVHAFDGSVDI